MANILLALMTVFSVLFSTEVDHERFVHIFFPNEVSITAELAVSNEERTRGLMFRERIDSDQGMLFVFEEEGIHSFWMKNMKISLDILWLDHEKRIIHIEKCVPP
ncbi:MAG: DUF192 domain-containing protein, partial [Candidatus Aminicenantes bacterium]|nr:DUF192 domain-containing protein [Candidatus Aminicenantes bacterium]